MAGPLFNMGTFFREIDQSQVDIEDLFYMLKQKPFVTEKENPLEFEYKKGKIEFDNLGFRHFVVKNEGSQAKEIDEKLLF